MEVNNPKISKYSRTIYKVVQKYRDMSNEHKELELSEYLYQKDEVIFKKTYVEWTEDWWNWIVGIPKNNNPAKDHSGRFSNQNQPTENVYFLAGELEGKAKRTVRIPRGRADSIPCC